MRKKIAREGSRVREKKNLLLAQSSFYCKVASYRHESNNKKKK